MSLESILLLIGACLAVNLSPGPSVLLVTSITASYGFYAGIMAVLGMTCGAFIHVVLAATGVAALLQASPLAFSLIQYAGAAYLIYLGVDLLRSPAHEARAETLKGRADLWYSFRRGAIVDALNPKIALFFVAFIPQFLNQVDNPGVLVSIALGSVFLLTGVIVNGSIAALVASGVSRTRGRFSVWIERRVPAAILILLGLRLLWQEN